MLLSSGLHKLWQPGSLAARKWREEEKIKRKWRENKEMKRKWRENEEMERDSLIFEVMTHRHSQTHT